MLVWSEDKITRLKAQAESPARGEFDRQIARCKLLACDGDQTAANKLLERMVKEYPNEQSENNRHPQELMIAAIIAGNFDVVRRLLDRQTVGSISAEVAVGTHSERPNSAVAWYISSPKACSFTFDPLIFELDDTEFYLSRWFRILPLCVHYLCSAAVESGKVYLSLDDAGTAHGLAFCDNRADVFLIPDPIFVQTRGYRDIRDHFNTHDVPWEQRKPVAFWRGGTSGRVTDLELGWRSLPRVKLCEIAARNPEILDAVISHIAQLPDAASVEELRASGLTGAYVETTEFNRSRYQIDIDGNTNAWAGLFQKLLSGSPVLKVASPAGYRQWYYARLSPWVNYVPVAADMTDLVEKVTWLREHDTQAREIGLRGKALAESMTYEDELQGSVATITAALRHFSGRAAAQLRFGSRHDDNQLLRNGWSIEEEDSVWAMGEQSQLEVPGPHARGAYVLDVELSPPPSVATIVQRVTIAINGEVVQRSGVSHRQTLRCPVPEWLPETLGPLRLTLLHPEVRELASAAIPGDQRTVGTRLHQVTLIALANAPELPVARAGVPAKGAARSAARTSRHAAIMRAIHGNDIWSEFVPTRSRPWPIQGWNGEHPAFKPLLEQAPNRTFIDVGAWKGQATVFVAKQMRNAGLDGCVIAVDSFLGTAAQWDGRRGLFGRSWGRPDLYETFLENVYYAEVPHLVVPLPQTSLQAAAVLRHRRITAGIVHLDASPDYLAVLADAEAYWPLIEPGGYLVGDDYNEMWPGVMRAAQEFSRKYSLELTVHKPKWIIRKPA